MQGNLRLDINKYSNELARLREETEKLKTRLELLETPQMGQTSITTLSGGEGKLETSSQADKGIASQPKKAPLHIKNHIPETPHQFK